MTVIDFVWICYGISLVVFSLIILLWIVANIIE